MPRIVMYVNIISPHQLPLAREIVRLVGAENFKYIYTEEFHAERKAIGWNDGDMPEWCVKGDENMPELMEADLVYTGLRCPSLMARRSAAGKKTVYSSERWFKPIPFCGVMLPGWLRMLSPRYRKLARQMIRLLNDPTMKYLPCGPWAAKDLVSIGLQQSQVVPWGYFVEPSSLTTNDQQLTTNTLKLLWVGRMLDWKRVDTIIRAVKSLVVSRWSLVRSGVSLDIYGSGPEEERLKKMATKYDDIIKFHKPVPIADVRKLMREHDVYVLASNGHEGWGAVVSEALEEGMKVVGTYEAGSSATMLGDEDLFHAGDWKRLAELIARCAKEKCEGRLVGQGIGKWTPKNAAKWLVDSVAG